MLKLLILGAVEVLRKRSFHLSFGVLLFVYFERYPPVHELGVDLRPLIIPHFFALDVRLQVAIDEEHANATKAEADVLSAFVAKMALESQRQRLRLDVRDERYILAFDEDRQVHGDEGRRRDKHDLIVVSAVYAGEVVQYQLIKHSFVGIHD